MARVPRTGDFIVKRGKELVDFHNSAHQQVLHRSINARDLLYTAVDRPSYDQGRMTRALRMFGTVISGLEGLALNRDRQALQRSQAEFDQQNLILSSENDTMLLRVAKGTYELHRDEQGVVRIRQRHLVRMPGNVIFIYNEQTGKKSWVDFHTRKEGIVLGQGDRIFAIEHSRGHHYHVRQLHLFEHQRQEKGAMPAERVFGLREVAVNAQAQSQDAIMTTEVRNIWLNEVIDLATEAGERVLIIGRAETAKKGGREVSVHVAIPDTEVSALHCEIDISDETIMDVNSTNGTFIDGKKIPPNQKKKLPPTCTLKIGNTEIVAGNLPGAASLPVQRTVRHESLRWPSPDPQQRVDIQRMFPWVDFLNLDQQYLSWDVTYSQEVSGFTIGRTGEPHELYLAGMNQGERIQVTYDRKNRQLLLNHNCSSDLVYSLWNQQAGHYEPQSPSFQSEARNQNPFILNEGYGIRIQLASREILEIILINNQRQVALEVKKVASLV